MLALRNSEKTHEVSGGLGLDSTSAYRYRGGGGIRKAEASEEQRHMPCDGRYGGEVLCAMAVRSVHEPCNPRKREELNETHLVLTKPGRYNSTMPFRLIQTWM
jgi:hypothetical protein